MINDHQPLILRLLDKLVNVLTVDMDLELFAVDNQVEFASDVRTLHELELQWKKEIRTGSDRRGWRTYSAWCVFDCANADCTEFAADADAGVSFHHLVLHQCQFLGHVG